MRFVQSIRVLFTVVLVVVGVSLTPGVVWAHAGDVALQNIGDKIVTGDWIEDGVSLSPCPVFESRFNDTGVDPNWTNEPGFDSVGGTWPVPSTISFNILDAVRVWDGSDFDFIANQQIKITYSNKSAITPLTSSTVAGFAIGVDSNGAWHRHLAFELLDSAYPNGFARDGIYALKLELVSSDALIAKSDPFHILFRQDEVFRDEIGTSAQLEAAVAYLEPVPEPGTLVLLLMAGLGALCYAWRRRRR